MLVQLSYAIGVAKPLSIYVDSYGTGKKSDEELVEIIQKNWDLRPGIMGNLFFLSRAVSHVLILIFQSKSLISKSPSTVRRPVMATLVRILRNLPVSFSDCPVRCRQPCLLVGEAQEDRSMINDRHLRSDFAHFIDSTLCMGSSSFPFYASLTYLLHTSHTRPRSCYISGDRSL
jgi:hypothetical protein